MARLAEAPTRLEIPIEGMTCASCVQRVETALRAVPGVDEAIVNIATERASVGFSGPARLGPVVEAIAGAGYSARAENIALEVSGMTCASCVSRIEKALASVPGVLGATVNLATGRADVRALAGATDAAALAGIVAAAGYEAAPLATPGAPERPDPREAATAALARAFAIAAVLTLPLFVLEMGGHLFPAFHHWTMGTLGLWNWRLQFALAALVLAGPGRLFFLKGVPALLRGAPDMNALVALGAGAAFIYSSVATFAPEVLPRGTDHVYYEAAAIIVTLILLGRWLEARARRSAGAAIRALVGLRPKTALVLRDGGRIETPVAEIRVGEILLARPGESVAVDGTIVEGRSWIDESMLSGESTPVAKSVGDEVVGGSINGAGGFTYRATRVGADTALARIIRMVENAQAAKLPIQGLVDRVTAWFVPAVIAAALVTFAAWMTFGPAPALSLALVNSVAVLIIACPCAMGLATPTSILVGTGRAAELGLLFRKGDALQSLRDATIVAFDKTGTLTQGRPALTDFIVAPGFDETAALGAVASLEARSEHHAARAIVAAAQARGVALTPASNFEARPGFGVAGEVEGKRIAVGSDRMMASLGLDVAPFADQASRLGDDGKSPLYAAIDGRLAAIVAVADPVKPTSAEAVRRLRALGLRVVMISGDNRRTAEAIGKILGIEEIVAEAAPDAKIAEIERLKASGARLAFVGDGVNDAPALAAADVGVAVGGGTDVALESADVVLMSGDPLGVPKAIALSRATMRNIAENLFWAFGYNVALIPVAAGALYPVTGTLLSPMLAAGAMALSSVFVVANALRLKRFQPR